MTSTNSIDHQLHKNDSSSSLYLIDRDEHTLVAAMKSFNPRKFRRSVAKKILKDVLDQKIVSASQALKMVPNLDVHKAVNRRMPSKFTT